MLLPIVGSLAVALTLLAAPAGAASATYETAHEAAMAGGKLSGDAAAALERKLEQAPDDLETRTVLLGYYFRNHAGADNQAARRRHVLWLIRNHPEERVAGLPYAEIDDYLDPDGFRAASSLWKEQADAHGTDVRVLVNASNFFGIRDASFAAQLLERAVKLEPKNGEWPGRLGDLHSRTLIGLEGADERRTTAARALEHYERALALSSSNEDRSRYLGDAAEVAFIAGAIDKARTHANELLATAVQGRWDHGNALHKGNSVLGRIALREGNVEAARRHLLASATEGSPQLDSFGPDMDLAKELLEKGERDAVLAYFDLCEKFWELGKERLADWRALVKDGRVPDFEHNLNY